jgi:GT2 family glycosyltransferase
LFFYGDTDDPERPPLGCKPDFDPVLARQWNYRSRNWLSRTGDDLPFEDWPAERVHHIPFLVESGKTTTQVVPMELPTKDDLTISVIVPVKDQPDLLRGLLQSIEKYEKSGIEFVVVDNGSSKAECLKLLEELEGKPNHRVVRAPVPFNYSRLNNIGACYAKGEVLALVNDDVELTQDRTLARLATLASQPGNGAIGPMLLYQSGAIQHGGVAMGYNGFSFGENMYVGDPTDQAEMDPKIGLTRRVTAVTGACLVIEKMKFIEVGGFDEGLPVTGNDADLCLKLQALGYQNVYAGSVRATHYAHQSRGQMDQAKLEPFWGDAARLIARWGPDLIDPYYSPSLGFNQDLGKIVPSRLKAPWFDRLSHLSEMP